MAEAVCSKLEACCSVRLERSACPAAISLEAVPTLSAERRITDTASARPSRILLNPCISLPISSRDDSSTCTVRSPLATPSTTLTACASGLTTVRTSSTAQAMKAISAATVATAITLRLRPNP